MSKIYLFVLALSASVILHAGGNIHFSEASWPDVTAQSAKDKKYVFLDCYTDWCYWCKVMDKEAFIDTSVTNFINANFIPTKREMEKDPEGIALCMKYHINGFPTYCVFSPDGHLVHKIIGYRKPDEFLKELKTALTMTAPLVPGFSTTLDPGFPEFYKQSFGTGKKRKMPEEKTVIGFLDTQKDLFSEVSWAVMWRFTLNEKYENFILSNNQKLYTLYGEEEVNGKIRSIISLRCKAAGEKNDEKALNMSLALIPKYIPADSIWLVPQLKYNFYRDTKNWKAFVGVIQSVIDTEGYESWIINDGSWTIYEQCDDKGIIKQAIVWMDSVTTLYPAYAPMDTYAALLYKDGQYKKAEEVALRAIELGETSGDDVSGTEALLANIRLKIK